MPEPHVISTTLVSDILNQMRIVIGRRNSNDPDSSDPTLLNYLNQFIDCNMAHDVKLFENFGTLTFTIDGTNPTGVYNVTDLAGTPGFTNYSQEAYISLYSPVDRSVSWNYLPIFQDPGEFFAIWGINNDAILVRGYPTNMLYYGNEFTFRTIPQEDTTYLVKIYGYKRVQLGQVSSEEPDEDDEFDDDDPPIPYQDWARYLVYGAAANYARDFRFEINTKNEILKDFSRERKMMLTHTHNQIKQSRAMPRF